MSYNLNTAYVFEEIQVHNSFKANTYSIIRITQRNIFPDRADCSNVNTNITHTIELERNDYGRMERRKEKWREGDNDEEIVLHNNYDNKIKLC